ncbi:MAG: alanine dehydrogenase [Waddliaceae bacterium]|nr:alanine dehydrogenase [Waddliaceae bacterium]
MIIGIPKEVKNHEYRVGATPAMVSQLVREGHQVMVQTRAGERIGFLDSHYERVGAKIVARPQDVYDCDMIIKVKEPQASEFPLMHEGQVIFGYLHLAPDPEQTENLLERGVVGIAYETVTDPQGRLPLLLPMSEIAGRVAVMAGSNVLQMITGGKGKLLGGVPGVEPAKVVILGGGVVGREAARMAMGLGADVSVLDNNVNVLRDLDQRYAPRLHTVFSNDLSLRSHVLGADLVIGAVLVAGRLAPRLITKEMIAEMKPGSVFVDVAIDQGGCAETSKPTTHSDPTYVVNDVVHYCVSNMPGAYALTATHALTNVTSRYAMALADRGWQKALDEDPHLRAGLNVCHGKITNKGVAEALNYNYVPPEVALHAMQ